MDSKRGCLVANLELPLLPSSIVVECHRGDKVVLGRKTPKGRHLGNDPLPDVRIEYIVSMLFNTKNFTKIRQKPFVNFFGVRWFLVVD